MKKISEFQWKQVQRDYLSADRPSLAALAQRHGIGLRTIKQKAAAECWRAQRDGQAAIAQAAISLHDKGSNSIDLDGLVRAAIEDIAAALPKARAVSKEGCATALVKLIDAYEARNPRTIADIVTLCRKHEINSGDFFRALDEAYAQDDASKRIG